MLAAPESPVWLQTTGRTAAAEAAARRLWGATAAGQLSDTAGAGAGKAAPVRAPPALALSALGARRAPSASAQPGRCSLCATFRRWSPVALHREPQQA